MNPRERRRSMALHRLTHRTGATLSQHAAGRCTELGYSVDEVHLCLANPEQTYPCPAAHGQDRRMYQRGNVAVVLAESTRTVVTVLPRTVHRWAHGTDSRRSLFPC